MCMFLARDRVGGVVCERIGGGLHQSGKNRRSLGRLSVVLGAGLGPWSGRVLLCLCVL